MSSPKGDENRHPHIHGVRVREHQFRPVGLSKRSRFRFRCLPAAPDCVGTFERGHAQCDGDPQSTEAAARLPCVWRRYCRGIRRYLLKPETGETAFQLVARLSRHELALHGERWADKPPDRDRSARRGPVRKRLKLGREAPLHPLLAEGALIFRQHLVAALPTAKIRAAGSCLVVADEGTFFEQKGFGVRGARVVRWFCSRGKRVPICAWRIKVIPDELLAVELPCRLQVARKVLGPEVCARLPVYYTPNSLGRWDCQLYGLTLGLMGEAAEAVAKLALSGELETVPWPPPPKPPHELKPWLWWRKAYWKATCRHHARAKAEAKARRQKRRGYK